MNEPQDPEAAEPVQNTNVPAVALPRLVEPLPCPFCGAEPGSWVADPGGPYPGGYFEICCENDDCAVGPCLSEKRRTDLPGMTHAEAEAAIWPELIAKWNLRHNDQSPDAGATGKLMP